MTPYQTCALVFGLVALMTAGAGLVALWTLPIHTHSRKVIR